MAATSERAGETRRLGIAGWARRLIVAVVLGGTIGFIAGTGWRLDWIELPLAVWLLFAGLMMFGAMREGGPRPQGRSRTRRKEERDRKVLLKLKRDERQPWWVFW